MRHGHRRHGPPWAHHHHAHGPHCRHFHHRFHRVRPRLQRRIFFWFGATIVFTAAVVMILFRLLSPTDQWRRQAEGMQRFVSTRIAEVWDQPARDRFVRDLHDELHLDATLLDARGAIVVRAGRACDEAWARVPVERDGARLGTLVVCGGERYPGGGFPFALVLIVAIAIMWAASGILARRLMRPLRRLERMARRIGEGDLSVRANLSPHEHGELGMLGVTMDEMAARIEKQLADQRELLAAVSHELRTPLGHLRVMLEMMRERSDGVRVDDLESEVMEVDALVGQLLASSRVDFGTLEASEVDAIEVAERALERAGLESDRLAVEGERRRFEADPTLLTRALANLLVNAQGHGRGVSSLEVRFEPEQIVFAVEDQGPGFTAEEREKVFEPFYRGEHRAGASLGLGLSLVRRIAEAHGGRAWIEDVEGGGARVLFSIATPA